jgi:hypothetical protein
VKEQNPTRAWRHALEAWTVVLGQLPDDGKARRWHAKSLNRLSRLEGGVAPERLAAEAAEAVDALLRCARILTKQLNDHDAALKVWEQVLIEEPGHADAHGGRCRCLMLAGRWAELPAATEAGLPYLAPGVLERLAQQATKQERWSEALQLWRLLARQGAGETPIAHLVESQILCAHKLGFDAYRPEIPLVTGTSGEAPLSVHGRRPRLRNRAPRHIVMMGVSFCGSTLLGLVLGGLPGVANVGESHWLIEKRRQRSSDELPTTPEGFEQCMSCGPGCPIVTVQLRQRLAEPDGDFYATLAAAYGADTIVTSDKSPQRVLTLDPYLHNDTIVLFREPMANWHSHRVRHPAFASPEGQRDYFGNWADSYEILLRYFHNKGSKTVVNFDEFAAAPQRGLALICRTLSLPFDPKTLAYWRTRQHFVGGNIMLALRLRDGVEAALRIGPRPVSPDADPMPEAAHEFARARRVWEALRQRQLRRIGE